MITDIKRELDLSISEDFDEAREKYYKDEVKLIHQRITNYSAIGSEYIGWIEQPSQIKHDEIHSILKVAREIRAKADVLVVVGIGGSYLGTKAIKDALSPYFKTEKNDIEVLFLGQNLSGKYIKQLLTYLEDKEFYVNVISKSGTTTEPAIGFRILYNYMVNRYGKDLKNRIIATTSPKSGALRSLSDERGFRTFIIPEDIGGRYSVFTPVGLLPLAVQGIDIEQLISGAKNAAEDFKSENLEDNAAYQYAAVRHYYYSKGNKIELFSSSEPSLVNLHEWWKQLFGESEGKDGKGLFPASVSYSTDLHSLGQYVQDGSPILFETILDIGGKEEDIEIPFIDSNRDRLNYLAGRTVNEINAVAVESAVLAHTEAGVPVIRIRIAKLDEYNLGYLMYFFMKACAMSAYLLGVNPFDQPGVEAYKKNMYAMLGKPGFEREGVELLRRLQLK